MPNFSSPKDIENEEAIDQVTKRNAKSALFNKTEVLPTTRNAKPYLQKEVIRHAILKEIDLTPRVGTCT